MIYREDPWRIGGSRWETSANGGWQMLGCSTLKAIEECSTMLIRMNARMIRVLICSWKEKSQEMSRWKSWEKKKMKQRWTRMMCRLRRARREEYAERGLCFVVHWRQCSWWPCWSHSKDPRRWYTGYWHWLCPDKCQGDDKSLSSYSSLHTEFGSATVKQGVTRVRDTRRSKIKPTHPLRSAKQTARSHRNWPGPAVLPSPLSWCFKII